MDRFVIACPWCAEISAISADFERVTVTNESQIEEIVAGGASDMVFRCANAECPAPTEVVICGNPIVAQSLQQRLTSSWMVPRRSRLVTDTRDRPHPFLHTVLFNRRRVRPQRSHSISALIDAELLEKAVLGFAVSHQAPVTLFEGLPTASDEIFWLRTEFTPHPGRELPFQYNSMCSTCRTAFGSRIRARMPSISGACEYEGICPSRVCRATTATSPEGVSGRCLRAVKLMARYDLCHSSDLGMIRLVQTELGKPAAEQRWPVIAQCWRGLAELALPIVVHNYLSAVVLTGQFVVGGEPPTRWSIAEAERKWRAEHHEMDQECTLSQLPQSLLGALDDQREVEFHRRGEVSYSNGALVRATSEELHELGRELGADVKTIEKVANDRYLQKKGRAESVFSAELAEIVSRNLIEGKELRDFLPSVLHRMKTFWAFKRASLFVRTDVEDEFTLYATSEQYLADSSPPKIVPRGLENLAGTWPLLTACGRVSDDPGLQQRAPDATMWLRKEGLVDGEKLTYVLSVRSGDRVCVFCFNERDTSRTLALLRVSSEARHQDISPAGRLLVEMACRKVAEDLYHFWLKYDQMQTYRALAHTLRNPVSLMYSPSSALRQLLQKYATEIQPAFPDLYDAAKRLLAGVRTGAYIVDDELSKLTLATTLEEQLSRAAEGTADLIGILQSLRRRYELIGEPNGKTWEGNERQVKEAKVRGSEDLVRLAVQNVLDNAYKYSFNSRPIMVTVVRGTGAWILSVRDHGIAIASEERPRIAQKGYRGVHARKRKRHSAEGTGLGMYLVKRILEAVGGTFSIVCTPCDGIGEGAGTGEVEVLLRFCAADRRHLDG